MGLAEADEAAAAVLELADNVVQVLARAGRSLELGDHQGDAVPVPAFGPRMVCRSCGIIGAHARPN